MVPIRLLQDKHPMGKGEWVTFAELRNQTGYSRDTRYLDFFAVSCWPSKGDRRIAYEIKMSRNDFLNEIKSPKKRAFAESVSTECYFVCPQGMVKSEEVPEGWGLYYVNAGGLRREKIAYQRTPGDWPQEFIISMIRHHVEKNDNKIPKSTWLIAGKELSEEEIENHINKRYKDRIEAIARKYEYNKATADRHARLVKAIQQCLGYQYETAEKFYEWFRGESGSRSDALFVESMRTALMSINDAKMRIEKALERIDGQSDPVLIHEGIKRV